jgi:hypothetical protein
VKPSWWLSALEGVAMAGVVDVALLGNMAMS